MMVINHRSLCLLKIGNLLLQLSTNMFKVTLVRLYTFIGNTNKTLFKQDHAIEKFDAKPKVFSFKFNEGLRVNALMAQQEYMT